jgi:hypothetical protein
MDIMLTVFNRMNNIGFFMNNENNPTKISKSQFCKGRKCLKRVWLYNNRKDLKQETSTFQESILTQGNEVGALARQLYPTGELIHEDYTNIEGAIEHTKLALQNGATAIFESAFIFKNIVIRTDILCRNNDGTFDLIEVKSSTKLKPKEHLPDIAIQTFVLRQLGISLGNINFAFLNNKYERKGCLDLSKLFIIQPVNELLDNELKLIPAYLAKINKTLSQNIEPHWNLGSICNAPYTCEFKHYCWRDVTEKSIHYLTRINDKKRQALLEINIELIKDIPDDFKLSPLQHIQVTQEKIQARHIDIDAIKNHLSTLKYPLYFLDFETIGYAIPRFDGTRPYQKLTFQYSLHVKDSPGSPLLHYEFLCEKNENPMRFAAEKLIQHIGLEGSIIVYNKSFEESCIRDMARTFSDLSPRLENMIERLWDLIDPFAKKWFYDPAFNGSASIKKVLPVLAPDLSYKTLGIKQGDEAQAMYLKFISDSLSINDKEKIKKDLLEYCKMDTFAMVRIMEELRD